MKDWHVELAGGDNEARSNYGLLLAQDLDLQARLILYASNRDRDLRDKIEERAAIRWADGLPGDLLSAVKCNLEAIYE